MTTLEVGINCSAPYSFLIKMWLVSIAVESYLAAFLAGRCQGHILLAPSSYVLKEI